MSRAVYEYIGQGKSSFTVEVPRSFCSEDLGGFGGQSRHREFYFSDLTLVPGYFSQKAFQLGVESDVAERKVGGPSQEYNLRYEVVCKKNLYYDGTTGMLQDKFHQQRNRAFDLEDLVRSVNDFFEDTKPVEITSLPFFIDWVDLGWTQALDDTVFAEREREEEERVEEEDAMEVAEEERGEVQEAGRDAVEVEQLEEEIEEAQEAVVAQPVEEEIGEAEQEAAVVAQPVEEEEEGDEEAEDEPAQVRERKRRQASEVEEGGEEEVQAQNLEQGTPGYFEYYVKGIAESYYGEEYSEGEHNNALPNSARNLGGVNNFKLPSDIENVASLRLRLHIAPMTVVQFSNNLLLEDLGFTEKSYGAKVGRRFTLKNSSPNGYVTIEAEKAPKAVVLPVTPTVFFCAPLREVYFSPFVSVSVTQEKFKSNESIFLLLQEALARLNSWANIFVSVGYSGDEKKFRFVFPTARMTLKLQCDSRLAERLGYGLVQLIGPGSLPGVAVAQEVAIDADGLSRALVWDTVLAAVCLENSSSITAYGFNGPLLATLTPQDPGVLTLKKRRSGSEEDEAAARAPTVQSGQATVPLTFSVWTFGKKSSVVPLHWPVHCFAAGILRGRWERR